MTHSFIDSLHRESLCVKVYVMIESVQEEEIECAGPYAAEQVEDGECSSI